MPFQYEKAFQLGPEATEYVKLTDQFVQTIQVGDRTILKVQDEGLTLLAQKALEDVSFKLRPKHLAQVAAILRDPEASDNDKFVAKNLIDNAVVAVQGQLPSCQDTGTAIVLGKKGQYVWTEGEDEAALSQGIYQAYQSRNLRYSQNAPLNMFDEINTGSNLPAQIDLLASKGHSYEFLFLAKGGGSANKTYLFQETKALLNPLGLEKFVREKLKSLGTSACPPYHIALVIGGTSAETVMKTVKLATAGYLDELPNEGSEGGRYFRDREWEQKILELCQSSGIGAQFGGKYFAHDVKVIRGPRHGASCPVGLAVSCSADRNIKAKITSEGIFLEKLEENPARFLEGLDAVDLAPPVQIDLDRPMDQVLAELSKHPVKTRLSLTGTLIVARDIAHAKIKEMLDRGEPMPEYLKNHPVYYAGPAKTPEGMATGSFGPTTAGRMDAYVNQFQAAQGSMIMLAKGNRSKAVTDACAQYGGFYLGSVGGPAAILAKENIVAEELVAFPELGMEAVRKIQIKDFPAFIIVDDKGNDFFSDLV